MSLANKIKSAFSSSDQDEATTPGAVGRTVPGAFPTDDMTESNTATSGSHHNKLHKPNDPRGWDESENLTKGHGYTDSGVGIIDNSVNPNDRQSGPAVGGGSYEKSGSTTQSDLFQKTDHPTQAAQNTGTGATAAEAPFSSSRQGQNPDSWLTNNDSRLEGNKPAAHEHDTLSDSRGGLSAGSAPYEPASEAARENTDLPKTGEDASDEGHKSNPPPYWGDIPRGTGVYNTVTGHGSPEDATRGTKPDEPSNIPGQDSSDAAHQREFMLRPSATEQVGKLDDPARRETDNIPGQEAKPTDHSSRSKEAMGGAGIGAGAGLAAYELSQQQRDRDNQKGLDRQNALESQQAPAEPDHQKGGIFHRSQGDEHHAKHETPKEPKEEKESKLAGIFHRDHKDEKEAKPKHTGNEESTHHKHDADNRRKEADEAALAAATTAYAMHPPADREINRQKETTTTSDQPKEKKEGNKILGLFHRSHKDKDQKEADEHGSSTDQTPGQHKDDNIKREVAATGAGAGAGYAASKFVNKDNDTPKETSIPRREVQSSTTQPLGQTSAQQDSQVRNAPELHHRSGTVGRDIAAGAATGAGAGYGASRLAGEEHGASNDSTAPRHDQTPSSAQHPLDKTAQDPSKDHTYNVLSSGTPSGMYQDTPRQDAAQADQLPTNRRDNGTAARDVAAGAAAGVGAGYAASKLGHEHNAPKDSTLTQDTAPTTAQRSLDRSWEDPSNGRSQNALVSGTTSDVRQNDPRQEVAQTSQSPEQQHKSDTVGRDIAAGAAAGAGTSYAASKLAGQEHNTSTDTANPRDISSGTADKPLDRTSAAHGSIEPPLGRTSDDPSKGGMYNVLASGTPSGIHRPGDDHPNRPEDHHGSKAAGVGAGAVGAGAAALGTERALERKPVATETANQQPEEVTPAQKEPVAEKKEPVPEQSAAAAPLAAVDQPNKVTHKCVKCGEENDITSYFNKK